MDNMVIAVALDHPDGEAGSQRDCDKGPEREANIVADYRASL
jgi:hypothetical protein